MKIVQLKKTEILTALYLEALQKVANCRDKPFPSRAACSRHIYFCLFGCLKAISFKRDTALGSRIMMRRKKDQAEALA